MMDKLSFEESPGYDEWLAELDYRAELDAQLANFKGELAAAHTIEAVREVTASFAAWLKTIDTETATEFCALAWARRDAIRLAPRHVALNADRVAA